MTKPIKADSLFQVFIKDFADNFGIQNSEELEPQMRAIIPEFVQIDAVVSFPDDFDFTTLQERIFPFWSKYNVIEYKGIQDRLAPMHIYQYSLTELGIMTTYLLSEERKERKERQPLSQKATKAQWQRLCEQGAKHSCCNTILSTADPVGVRKTCQLEPVDTYEHLSGALYRRVIWEDQFIGSIATYLVVLNDLPVCPINAPLLLLSTGQKQVEFCEWLLETHEGVSLREKERYLLYLVGYDLVKDREILSKMLKKNRQSAGHAHFIIEQLAEARDDKAAFVQELFKIILKTDSPTEAAQKMLQVDSPADAAQKMLQVDSPADAAQKMLQVDSPLEMAQMALHADSPTEAAQKMLQVDSREEAALSFIQSEEEVYRLLELVRQKNAKVGNGPAEDIIA